MKRHLQSNRVFAACLVGLLALYVLVAAPWPQLGPDEAAWSTSVVKVLAGKVLGRDAMMAKGPYLLGWHLLAYVATGPNVMALHLLGAAWALLTGVVVCLVALRFAGRVGLLATGLLYVGAMADPALRTNVYAEIIMALPLALGMMALTVGLSRSNLLLVAAAGFCAGLALLTKQTAIFYALAMVVVVVVAYSPGSSRWRRGEGGWRDVTKGWLALLAGGLLAALPWLAYLWHHGAGASFVQSFIGGGTQYVARLSAWWSLVHVMPRYTIVLVVSVAGLVLLSKQGARSRKQLSRGYGVGRQSADGGEGIWYLVACAWYVAAVVAVAVTGRFAAHYFTQLFPPAALLGGLWIAHKLRSSLDFRTDARIDSRRSGFQPDSSASKFNIGALVLAAQLLVLIPVGAMNFGYWRTAVAVTAASPWRQVGEYIRERTDPQDTVFVWGDQTEVVYWAGRELASDDPWITLGLLGFSHQGPLFATRVHQYMDWQRLRDELDRWQPAYVVIAPVIQTVEPPQCMQFGTEQLPELKSILNSGYDHETTIAGYEIHAKHVATKADQSLH